MRVKRALLRFDEVQEILGCSKRHIYDLLATDKLKAHNPGASPGTRGTKIVADSVQSYLESGTIPSDSWSE